jgi:colanic acid/amylovoran biosynthesis glycosyltransferase
MAPRDQDKSLRIAYLVGSFPSRSETFVINQIAGIARLGHHVEIYTTGPSTMKRPPDIVNRFGLSQRTRRLDPGPQRLFAVLRVVGAFLATAWRAPTVVWRALRKLREAGGSGGLRFIYATLSLIERGRPRYDAIHAQFGPYGILASQLVEVGAMRGPVVTSIRGYDAGKDLAARPPLYRELFQRGALFLPVSQALAKRLIDAGCDPAKIRVHHSGITYRGWHYRERRYDSRQPLRMLTVARLVEKKGVAYALEAVAKLRTAGREVSYVVIGDGPLYGELARQAQTLGIGAHVRFIGAQSHDAVRWWLDASHVLVAPSLTAMDGDVEGIPNAVKEAMAVGLPVVSTVHGGIPELIEPNYSGVLVPERDAAALAEALRELIEHPERWPTMTRAARRKIDDEFNIDRLSEELVDHYARLAGRARVTSSIAEAEIVDSTGATQGTSHA